MAGRGVCSVDQCGRTCKAKGVCEKHYMRLRRTGHLGSGRNLSFDRAEAFAARVERDESTGCLIWTGAKSHAGYGVMTRGGGRMVGAHRYAWEQVNGPTPEGAQIDHACHNRACVEASHLRLADAPQNGWNRSGANKNNARGVRNVYPEKKRYRVYASKNGVRHDRGLFDTVEEAAEAAARLRLELFGEFAGRGA